MEKKQQADLINSLSRQLQSQLLMDANKLVLKEVKILSQHFSEELMKHTANIIKELNSTPDEIIFSEGEIKKGRCEIFIEKNNQVKQIKVLSKGDYFGSYGFFTGNQRLCGVRSKDFCTLLYITRDDFLDLCKKYLLDYEKFCFIKDKLQFQKEFQLIEEQCFQCKEKTHIFKECPQTHFNNKSDYIQFLTKESQQCQIERVFQKRQVLKIQQTLLNYTQISSSCVRFQQKKSKEIEQYMNDNYINALFNMYDSDENQQEQDESEGTSASIFSAKLNDTDTNTKKQETLSQFSKRDNRSVKTTNESLKQIQTESDEIFNKVLEESNEQNSKEQNINKSLNKSNSQDEQSIRRNQKKLVQQLSNSIYFKNLIKQSCDRNIEQFLQKTQPLPIINKDPAKTYNGNIKLNKQQVLGERISPLQNLKDKIKGVNKMVNKVKKIMNVSVLFKKKTMSDKKEEQMVQQQIFTQTNTNNQLTFYLLQQKNIQEQSYTYEFLQNEFEHMNKYKMYYPSGNYDIIITSYNKLNFEKNLLNEKNKPLNEAKKKLLNKIEKQFYQDQGSIAQQSQNQEEILSLFNHYRGMQFQKKKSYLAPIDNSHLSPILNNSISDFSAPTTKREGNLDLNSISNNLDTSNRNYRLLNSQHQNQDLNLEHNKIDQKNNDKIDQDENVKNDQPILNDKNQISFSIRPLNNSIFFNHEKYTQD